MKIKKIIDDIMRNGNEGIGHPKRLTGDRSGWWSRHIDNEHRIVYRINDDTIEINHCKGHYDDE